MEHGTTVVRDKMSEPGPAKVSTRERILEAATDLFYAQGLRSVSADKIIERVGITKVTFYRHFRTKDDLVVAYLERQAERERADVAAILARAGGDANEAIRLFAETIGTVSCTPGFRGCPFINAAAEYADQDHPVRRTVAAHRHWFRAVLEEMITPLHPTEPAGIADQLVLLRDGAMVSGYLGDPATVSRSLYRAARAVISSHM
ncbi:TetR/AcrR family transcriptional regulator [Streptacidiphilus sp. EB129]|uniref:TetR/AcrR family transcriptional regulator n=1 Tax=Streptacidiphilus sp. EB129 TaxID=3156262 RepID=UPI0035122A45